MAFRSDIFQSVSIYLIDVRLNPLIRGMVVKVTVFVAFLDENGRGMPVLLIFCGIRCTNARSGINRPKSSHTNWEPGIPNWLTVETRFIASEFAVFLGLYGAPSKDAVNRVSTAHKSFANLPMENVQKLLGQLIPTAGRGCKPRPAWAIRSPKLPLLGNRSLHCSTSPIRGVVPPASM
jgi:hypothetical protein